MQSERESIIRLCNPKSKVSSHFVIKSKWKIYRLVQDNKLLGMQENLVGENIKI